MKLWYGVVEDRFDPLFLGRCRVRVVGVHTSNKNELPTEDLPWAYPLGPITSASMNGIGHAPVGPVEGSWCVVTFDDEAMQHPFILGTIGGIPLSKTQGDPEVVENYLFEVSGGEAIITPPTDDRQRGVPQTTPSPEGPAFDQKFIGPLSEDQVKNQMLPTLRQRESSGNYKAQNSFGFSGAYQFGVAFLEDLGYVKKGTWAANKPNAERILRDGTSGFWTGKNGIRSTNDFLSNKTAQDTAMVEGLRLNYKRLKNGGYVTESTPPEVVSGLLFVAHLKGMGKGGVSDFVRGVYRPDAFGTSPKTYYELGQSAIVGKSSKTEFSNETPIDTDVQFNGTTRDFDIRRSQNAQTRNSEMSQRALSGFNDPFGKYPLDEWLKEPDTHRLARHTNIEGTIVGSKEQTRLRGERIAGGGVWEQPAIPYNTVYPFNHVYGTESGHIMEFDDTQDAERIHLYHKAGTFIEIDANGTQVNRVVGTRVTIAEADDLNSVSGHKVITIGGNLAIVVGGSCTLEVQGTLNIKAKEINLEAKEDLNLKAGGQIKMLSDKSLSMRGSTISGDAKSGINWNMGAASHAQGVQSMSTSLTQFKVNTRSQSTDFLLEDASEAISRAEIESRTNEVAPDPVTAAKSDTTPPAAAGPAVVACGNIPKPYSPNTLISTNYTLRSVCGSSSGFPGTGIPPSEGQHNLSQDALVCNLMKVCVNVLEPIRNLYPDVKINSGLRRAGNRFSLVGRVSKHELGQALDISFSSAGKSRDKYYEIAKAIKNSSIPWTKIILEFIGNSEWIHVEFVEGAAREVYTTYNGSNYERGLILR